MSLLPTTTGCEPCCTTDETVVQVPGPEGPAGADGTNGTDGQPAYTTASTFVMPAELANVAVTVVNNDWCAVGEVLWLRGGSAQGYFQVIAKPTSTTLTLKNLADTASGAYSTNSAPATVFQNLTTVQPGGLQGPTGATLGGVLLAANNLSDVASPGDARLNLGLGTAAQHDIGVSDGNAALNDGNLTAGLVVVSTVDGISTPVAATARTALGLGTAAIVDTGVANGDLPPVDTTFTNGNCVFATASGVQTKTASAARTALGLGSSALSGGYGRLYQATSLSLAAIADFAVSLGSLTKFRLDRVTLSNGSATLGTARFGVFTAAGGGGTAYALAQAAPNLSTGAGTQGDLVLEAVAGLAYLTATFYFRVTTAQAGQTVDVSIWGWDLS